MADRVGQRFGDYRLTRFLGDGGVAEVYLGEHIYLHTESAVKVLKGMFTAAEIRKFHSEAQTIARLKHPHIVGIITFSVAKLDTHDIPFLVMDYAPQGSLDKRHPRGSKLPLATIVSYVKPIAEALQYAHNHKVIHRDVKPANFLLGEDEEILLSDFGIAVVAHRTVTWEEQKVAGTWAYTAPEQFKAEARFASDQYSLGVTVYQWLCGELPFQGSIYALPYQHETVAPPPLHGKIPDISPAIEQVVLKALAKQPENRFASVYEFATALEQACQEAPTLPVSSPVNLSSVPPAPVAPTERVIPPTQFADATSQAAVQPALIAPTERATPPTQPANPVNQPTTQSAPIQPIERVILPAQIVGPATANQASARSAQPTSSQYSYRPSIRPPVRANPGFLVVPLLVIVVLLVVYARLSGTTFVTTYPGPTTTTVTRPAALVTSNGTMFGVDAQHTHYNPDEHLLTPTNVSSLVQDWTATTGSYSESSPVVANGVVYIGSDAFKASGCGKASCSPLWTASDSNDLSSPAVANGILYSYDISDSKGNLYAFKASGCGKASCSPLWTASVDSYHDSASSPVVINGVVYVTSEDKLYAFKASGCGRASCSPLWTAFISSGNYIDSSPAAADGVIYLSSGDGMLYAFSASGCKSLSCSPLWTASTGDTIDTGAQVIASSPAVANGVVYIGSVDGKLHAFKASGCGSPFCSPLWTASIGSKIFSSPAVANGVVYIGSTDSKLYAFKASGCGSPSCSPWWTASTGGFINSSPTVANGVVYTGSGDSKLYAFNALGCGNASCPPLWAVSTGGIIDSSPAVANGLVYVSSEDGKLYTFHLRSTTP